MSQPAGGGERRATLLSDPRFTAFQSDLEQVRIAIFQAADAGAKVAAQLHRQDYGFSAGGRAIRLRPNSRLFVVGLGKAAPAMCIAVAAALGSLIDRGIAAVPKGTTTPPPDRMTFFPAGHPQPDEGSLAGGLATEALLADTTPDDIVLTLISGGGSAMLEIPVAGVSLNDLQVLNTALIRSGAPIQEINIVRSALSRSKSGGLARLTAPARSVGLILSDVVGDRLSSIASGPTVLRVTQPRRAVKILKSYDVWTKIPTGIRNALTAQRPRPKPTPRPVNILIGSNRVVIDAAKAAASRMGFPVHVLSRQMHGEARAVGRRLAFRMAHTQGPKCLIMGGETTVRVRGSGRGGRNQELALSAAVSLDGTPGVALMTLATDGVDGPTDAAGAIVTGQTAAAAREVGLDLVAALADNDAYPCLDRLGALIRTGPTGTNLNDIAVGLVYLD